MENTCQNNADQLHRSGVSAWQNGDLVTALKLVLEAIKADSNAPRYYNTFGVILAQTGRERAAIKAYRKAIELNNDYAQAYSNLGNSLQKQNNYAESIEHYTKAIELNPDYAEAHNNLASALYKLGDFKAAIKHCRKAIEINADYAEAYNTLAAALNMDKDYDEAIECYNKTIELAPDYAQAYYSRGMSYLRYGRFAKGWEDYQWRLKTDGTKILLRCDKPWWRGENFQGKTLLVQSEQGFGDSIQFVRYLPMVKDRGTKVILAEKPELIDLFRDLEGIDDLVSAGELEDGNVKYDLYVPLLNLPGIFNTTADNIPARIPYLSAKEPKVAHWRNKTATEAFKIGIAWAGNPIHTNDHNRSCALQNFTPLAEIDNVKLFSLQKGPGIEQIKNWQGATELIDLGQDFEDFTDTAAAIENMDLVISVDTSVLHLAGAMAKTAWALIPCNSDWRWMLNRQDSPWYPTITLLRQKQHGNWKELFHRVAHRVEKLITNETLM